jgi:hypothetical protein
MKLLALLVLAFVGIGPLPAAAQSIKVGAVVPLTGRYGSGGAQVRAGYEIAVEHVNAAGGVTVGGKKMPLELVLLDDESDATKTVSRLETLAAQGVVVYLGGFGSDLHAAASSVAEKNRVPYLGVAFALNKVHQQGFRYLFSPFWKSPDIGRLLPGMLSAIPAAERPKTVAIFQEKTDWGSEMAATWVEAGRTAGYQVVVQGEYAPGAKDFSDLVLKAKAANADAVFALPTPPDGMTMIKQMKELGYTPKLTLFIRDLVQEPGKGRRLCHARARLAQRREGARREGAERGAREEDGPSRRSHRRPGLCVHPDRGRRRRARRLARPGEGARRHRRHRHDDRHRTREVPPRRHGRRPVGVPAVAQRQAGAGVAQGVGDGTARLPGAALREALTLTRQAYRMRDAAGPPPRAAVVLYRTTPRYNAVQERSRYAY